MSGKQDKKLRQAAKKIAALAVLDERKRILGLIANMRDEMDEGVKNKIVNSPAEARLMEVRKEIGQAVLFQLATHILTNRIPELKRRSRR